MGNRGPVGKPTAIKELEGNPGKRPLPENEPQPEKLTAVPKPPSFLDPLAKRHWKVLGQQLLDCGLLTHIDLDAFSACCNCYALWVKAQTEIKKTGLLVKTPNGFPMPSPYIKIAGDALDRMMRYLKEFGMTPAARSRVQVDIEKEEEDELERLLKNKRPIVPQPSPGSFK